MKVETHGPITVIKDTKEDITNFLMKVTHEHKSFEKQNLILDISVHSGLAIKDINAFSSLAKAHKKAKKSFVLVVAPNFDFNKAPASLNVVPSVQEAHDLIEMDEIERDLGF